MKLQLRVNRFLGWGVGKKFLSYIKWRLASLKTGFKVRQEEKFTEKAGKIDYKGQRLL